MSSTRAGEFEQVVLLAILQCGDQPYAPRIREILKERADRVVSRGALYRTFDRLEAKGFLEWELEDAADQGDRGGRPLRRFRATPEGLHALQASRAILLDLWRGVEDQLEGGVS